MVQELHALTVLQGKDNGMQIRHLIWVAFLLVEFCRVIRLNLIRKLRLAQGKQYLRVTCPGIQVFF